LEGWNSSQKQYENVPFSESSFNEQWIIGFITFLKGAVTHEQLKSHSSDYLYRSEGLTQLHLPLIAVLVGGIYLLSQGPDPTGPDHFVHKN
jgi:hypothetical protein